MICGGAEASITPLGVAGFAAMRVLSQRNDDPAGASRPWDVDCDGFVVGEGAGILVLEEIGSAVRRGAPILAEIVGYGMSADAHHLTAPPEDGDGVARVMACAGRRGSWRVRHSVPQRARHFHAAWRQGGNTRHRPHLRRPHVAPRGQLDQVDDRPPAGRRRCARGWSHRSGAREQMAPPTINLVHPDEENRLDLVPNRARHIEIGHAMTNSFGFGGTNASLIFKRAGE